MRYLENYAEFKERFLALVDIYSGPLPLNFKDRIIHTYYQWVLNKLAPILSISNPTPETNLLLDAFFKENWALVKGTMVSPTAIPESELSLFLCDLASEVAPELNLKPAEVLFGNIYTEAVFPKNPYPSLDERVSLKTIIKTHILSDDEKTLIPISFLTEERYINGTYEQYLASDLPQNPYYYDEDAKTGQEFGVITPNEFRRLVAHSKHTEELKSALDHQKRLSQDKTDLGSQLTALTTRLRIEDAHGGRGRSEQVGEGAFTSLVEFSAFYEKLSDEQKSLIPSNLRIAIDKLLEVGGDYKGNMAQRIETCAGSRREQIERAMPSDKSILAQISLDSDLLQAEKVKAEEAIRQTRGSLVKLLTLNDEGYTNYQGGADTLSFNQHLLESLKVKPQVNNIEDLALIANLTPKELALILENNTTLQDQIVRAIGSLENLVMQTHLMSPDKLEIFLKILTPKIKALGIVNENLDADINALLLTHAVSSEAYKLLILYFSTSPLAYAIKNNQQDLVPYLIDKSANVNAKDNEGYTPLMRAYKQGHLELTKYLIEKDADVNIKGELGDSMLILACGSGDLEFVKYLIEDLNCEVNDKNINGDTALLSACLNDHIEVIRYLIAQKAHLNERSNNGHNALSIAFMNRRYDIVELLLASGANYYSSAGWQAIDLSRFQGDDVMYGQVISKILSTKGPFDQEAFDMISLKDWLRCSNHPFLASEYQHNKQMGSYSTHISKGNLQTMLGAEGPEDAFLKTIHFYSLLKQLLIKRADLERSYIFGREATYKKRLDVLSTLTCHLIKAHDEYLKNPSLQAQIEFSNQCIKAIDEARPILSQHRSTAALIFKCIVSFIFLPIFIYKACISKTLFKTDSENKIDELVSHLGLFQQKNQKPSSSINDNISASTAVKEPRKGQT